jgi:U2 small nuclear ribonucleoprotein A'
MSTLAQAICVTTYFYISTRHHSEFDCHSHVATMVRLTPDVILHSPQHLNCVGAYELTLRSLALPALENLGSTRDGFDTIDLSCNQIPTLGGHAIPRSPRLTALYLGSNCIRDITPGLASSVPNLTTLVLSNNSIATLADLNLDELALLTSLHTFALAGNPIIAAEPGLRSLLIHKIPSLGFIDFERVTKADRVAAVAAYGKPIDPHDGAKKGKNSKKRRLKEPNSSGPMDAENADTLAYDDEPANPAAATVAKLTKADVDAIKAAIVSATSLEQVTALQAVLQTGDTSAIKAIVHR